MAIYELILTSIALSMDAFAVAVCKGLSVRNLKKAQMLTVGLYFGFFQALMPLLGYFLGSAFSVYVENFAPYIAFVLLAFIGGNMIKEALECECEKSNDSFGFSTMLPLAVATSIDAMAAGIAFAMVKPTGGITFAVLLIGATTFVISSIGVKVGNIFGAKYKSKAELFGGIVLIGLGIKMLVEHWFFS